MRPPHNHKNKLQAEVRQESRAAGHPRIALVVRTAFLRAVIVPLTLGMPGPAARADEAAETLARQVVQQIQQERPALADYRIDCSWNKQPGMVWAIAGRSTHSAMGRFERFETLGPQEDIVFPTGLFLLLRRQVDPFPDEKSAQPYKPRRLPPSDVEGVACSVIEFSDVLPFGEINRQVRFGGVPVREWDSATLRWYIDPQNHIRRIAAVFRWKEWAGETDVRLTMDALVTRRKPKTGGERPLSPPPLWQIVAGSANVQLCVFAYSPDGRRLAIGSDMGATLYETGSWKPVAKLGGETVSAISFSPDNTTIVTAPWSGGRLRFWDAVAGTEKSSVETGETSMRSCTFLPGSRLLIGGTKRGALVWDRATASAAGRRMPGSDRTVIVSTDGRWAAMEQDSAILLHDLDGKQPDRVLGTKITGRSGISAPPSLAFSPDGKWIAIGDNWDYQRQSGEIDDISGRDPRVRVFEIETGKLVISLRGANGTILSLAFSPDGRMLAAGDEDNIGETAGNGAGVMLWDTASWILLGVMAVDGQPAVRQIVFAPDGKSLATTGYSSQMKIWTVPLLLPKR